MDLQLSNFQQDLNIFGFSVFVCKCKNYFYASTVNSRDLFTWGLRCNDMMQNKLIFIFFLMQWWKYKYAKCL
jgi:hypothetical protein